MSLITSNQIIHHVFFWLKNPNSTEDKQKLKAGLKTLEAIDEVKLLLIGDAASTLKRDVVVNDFDVSEMMLFDSIESQNAYQTHPIHQAFVAAHHHLWEKVVVYDMTVD
jgi:Stress responsive A/B Barrel Domain